MLNKMMPSLERVAPSTTNTKEFDNLRRYAMPTERASRDTIAEVTMLQKQSKIQEIGAVSQMPEFKLIYPGPQPAEAMQVFNANTLTKHFDTILRSSGT